MYVANSQHIGRTRNFSSPSPNWISITGAISGTIYDFVLDPFDPYNQAWVVGTTGVWKTTNLDAAAPVWSQLLSMQTISETVDPHDRFHGVGRILPSPVRQGYFLITVWDDNPLGGNDQGGWIGRTFDAGANWQWSQLQADDTWYGSPNHSELAPHTPLDMADDGSGQIWLGMANDAGQPRIHYSPDWGETWEYIKGISRNWTQPRNMYIPDLNPNMIYMNQGISVTQSTDGGYTWVDITPAGARPSMKPRGMAGVSLLPNEFFFMSETTSRGPAYRSSDMGVSFPITFTTPQTPTCCLYYGNDSVVATLSAFDPNLLAALVLRGCGGAHCPGEQITIAISDDGGMSWSNRTGDWHTVFESWAGATGSSAADGNVFIRNPKDTVSLVGLDPVYPNNWTMVLSLRPTLRWRGLASADRYRILLWRQGSAQPYVMEVDAGASRDPTNPVLHRYKWGTDLTSGVTLQEAGYRWQIYALDSGGNVVAASSLASFQIPSLGGDWGTVVSKGICGGPPGTWNCWPPGDPNPFNPYWNDYDDSIYRWSEKYDLPPAIIKAIMIGETGSTIGPRALKFPDETVTRLFPPIRAYLYEPYQDYKSGTRAPSQYLLPYNPPSGPYPYPYDRTVPANTKIYDYATSRLYGRQFSNLGEWGLRRIPGCEELDRDTCPATQRVAQYRVAASYGLGQIFYVIHYPQIKQLKGSDIPPERLYEPELNTEYMAAYLSRLRCTHAPQLGAGDTDYYAWRRVFQSYNGGGHQPYGRTVSQRAQEFAAPHSVISGVHSIQLEATGHICPMLYAGVWGSGVFRTADGGINWRTTGNAGLNPRVKALALDDQTGWLYAGIPSPIGLRRSKDAGRNWEPIDNLPNTDVTALALNPRPGVGILYVGTSDGVYRSADRGASWQAAAPIPDSNTVQALAVDPLTGTLYAATAAGVYSSTNQGTLWQKMLSIPDSNVVRALAYDERYGTLYAGLPNSKIYVYVSTDPREQWRLFGTLPTPGLVVQTLSRDPYSNILYAGTDTNGVYYTFDQGKTWTSANRGLPRRNVTALVMDVHNRTLSLGGLAQIATTVPEQSADEVELASGPVNLRGDGTPVWLFLSASMDAESVSPHGVIRIYADETRGTLLWQSPWIESANLDASYRLITVTNRPLLLVDWAAGAHSARMYGIQWDGTTYRNVSLVDLEGAPIEFIMSDAGGVIPFPDGSLVSLQQTYVNARERRVDAWVYGPLGYEPTRTYTYNLDIEDTNPPQTFATVAPPPNAAGWRRSPTQVTLTATDDYEVASIDYILTSSDTIINSASPLNNATVPLDEGRWTMAFYATDVYGNIEISKTLTLIWVDGTPPRTRTSREGALVTLEATDPALADGSPGSGVVHIEYSLDNGASWQMYTEPLPIDLQGTAPMLYRAIDLAGNVEETQRFPSRIYMPDVVKSGD